MKPKIDYDDEADVLYVSFGIDEPSYCKPLSNYLLLELGMFTNQPTGFRVLHAKDFVLLNHPKFKKQIEQAYKDSLEDKGISLEEMIAETKKELGKRQ